MNPFLTQIVIQTTLHHKAGKGGKPAQFTQNELDQAIREFRISALRLVRDIILIGIGVFSAAFGLKGFLLTNHFIDGGATGISLLLSALTSVPVYIYIIAINAPFVLLGYKIVGKAFALKTIVGIAGLALVLATVKFPDVTQDNLLVAVFGGFFLGAGIGLAVRGGGVIDGTEVLAIFLSRKLGTTMGDIIITLNIFIFSAAAYFLSVEIALYSVITYLAASKTLDFIIEGIEEYTGVTIISPHNDDIRKMIIEKMGRGVTIYTGRGGYGTKGHGKHVDILYTVVTRLELNRLNTELLKIDPKAFVVMSSVKQTKGGMVKKRPLSH